MPQRKDRPNSTTVIVGPAVRTSRIGQEAGPMSATKELIQALAESVVNDPDAVVVRERAAGGTTVFELSVAPDDKGRVIGKGGRMANAMRTLLRASAARKGKQVILEIV